MKKFVFIDIDGTLYDYKNHCVPESAKQALRKAKENGHELFICTGRAKEMVESVYLELPISGAVFGCGAHIVFNHQVIYEAHFPLKEMKELIHTFQENDIDYALEGTSISFFSERSMESYKNYYCSNPASETGKKFLEGVHMKKYEEMTPEDECQIIKMAFMTKDRHLMQNYLDHLPESLEYFVYSDSFSGDMEGEILIKGADKASSIHRVLEYFHGSIEDTIALGDSDNDVTMIETAHVGVAMGNACDPLKAKADYITADVDDDGLYKAFKYLGLI